MPIVSLREYGRMRGVSGAAVSKAIKAGRIKNGVRYDAKGHPKIDVDVADREWVRNTDGSHQKHLPEGHRLSAYAQPPGVTPGDEATIARGGVPPIDKSRAIREAYMARLAKLDYEERDGKLVAAEAIKAEMFTAARTVRDALLAIADREAPRLAGMTDAHQITTLLRAEITKALEKLIADAT